MTKDNITALADRVRLATAGQAALDEAAEILTVPRCTYPGCRNTRRTRKAVADKYFASGEIDLEMLRVSR